MDHLDFSVVKTGCEIRLDPLPWKQMTALDVDGKSLFSNDSDVTRGIREALEPVSESGCFVFGSHVRLDEAAHVVESWRNDEDRKEKTEYTLRQLGIVSLTFHLDHPSNLHWLNATWHKALEKYGLWSWAPSRASLDKLYETLLVERQDRQDHYDRSGEALWRRWDESSFATTTYDILILNPSGMLGPGQPIARRKGSQFCLFHPGADGHLHQDSPTGRLLLPFPVPRPEGSQFNTFLVALSCYNKLKFYLEARQIQGLPGMSPHQDFFISLERLVEEIWKPLEPLAGDVLQDRDDGDQEEDPEVTSQQGRKSSNREVQEHAKFLDGLSLPEKVAYGLLGVMIIQRKGVSVIILLWAVNTLEVLMVSSPQPHILFLRGPLLGSGAGRRMADGLGRARRHGFGREDEKHATATGAVALMGTESHFDVQKVRLRALGG
ncbi:hypothetical protein GGX14DRAFT_545968 [Mycena pura]|uniref:Uncharacterized protein n=1 Tax=Mycena pura TaxID=153505 RepID=A0AAD6UUJ7_9AGAR|nr:hypothetical protein GGX14DRAFT_545968 [Mycena pura]